MRPADPPPPPATPAAGGFLTFNLDSPVSQNNDLRDAFQDVQSVGHKDASLVQTTTSPKKNQETLNLVLEQACDALGKNMVPNVGVYSREGIIQQIQFSVRVHGSRHGHPLLLSSTQIDACSLG